MSEKAPHQDRKTEDVTLNEIDLGEDLSEWSQAPSTQHEPTAKPTLHSQETLNEPPPESRPPARPPIAPSGQMHDRNEAEPTLRNEAEALEKESDSTEVMEPSQSSGEEAHTEVLPQQVDSFGDTLVSPSDLSGQARGWAEAGRTERIEDDSELHQPTLFGEPSEPSFPPADFAPPPVSGYRLLEELGRGGMGVVYKAEQPGLNRTVALKMVLAGGRASTDELVRFREEARVLADLQHPNIVQVFEVGDQNGLPFFSLEYVEGGTLSGRAHKKVLTPEQAARVLLQLAEAMDLAHARGIIHRDLKPANVLIAGDPDAPIEECVPKITDFGLAKRFDNDSGQTRQGTVMGTPSYMPPEQAQGQTWRLGPPADIYALGAILYDLLTGQPPFKGKTVTDTLEQVLNVEPRPPMHIRPSVPHDLQVISLKCLEKDPADRYRCARDLADDLRAYLNNEPIKARPTAAWERTWKWVKRSPALATLGLLCFLSLIALGIGSVVYARHQAEAARTQLALRQDAEQQRERAESEAERARAEHRRAEGEAARAEKERQRAEANFRTAKKAVRRLTLVGHRRLRNVPQAEPVRKALLTQALEFHREFLDINGSGPEQRAEVGRAQLRIAEILEMLDRREEAEKAYRQALEIFDKLRAEQTGEEEHVRALAAAWNDLAILLQSAQRLDEAEQAIDNALTLKTGLVASSPGDPDRLRDLANSHNNRGHLHQMRGRIDQAIEDYSAALTHLKNVPENEAREDRARAKSNLGAARLSGQPGEALKLLDESIELWQRVVEQSDGDPTFQRELAASRFNRATLHHLQGRGPQAEQEYREARDLLEGLIKLYPMVVDYRELLITLCTNQAHLYRSARHNGQSVEAWEKSVSTLRSLIKEHPDRRDLRQKLGLNLNELAISLTGANKSFEAEDAWKEALSIQEKLTGEEPKNEVYWQDRINSQVNLATLLRAVSPSVSAEKAWRTAVSLAEQRDKHLGSKDARRREMAGLMTQLAGLLRKRAKEDEAENWLEKAKALSGR